MVKNAHGPPFNPNFCGMDYEYCWQLDTPKVWLLVNQLSINWIPQS